MQRENVRAVVLEHEVHRVPRVARGAEVVDAGIVAPVLAQQVGDEGALGEAASKCQLRQPSAPDGSKGLTSQSPKNGCNCWFADVSTRTDRRQRAGKRESATAERMSETLAQRAVAE